MSASRILFLGVVVIALLVVMGLTAQAALSARPGITLDQAGSDYFQRHPELVAAQRRADTTDYFQRHPQATIAVPASSVAPLDLAGSDYFQRHPELVPAPRGVDTTDYYFRHPELVSAPREVDTTDYYFRHLDLNP